MECMGVASGSGWNLWVWLLVVVVRRYMLHVYIFILLMRLALRLRVAHLRGPTRDQKAVRTIYIIINIYIYTDSEIIVLTRWGSLRFTTVIYIKHLKNEQKVGMLL